MLIKIAFSAAKRNWGHAFAKFMTVDHHSGLRSQDFEASVVQWPNHILIDLKESWF